MKPTFIRGQGSHRVSGAGACRGKAGGGGLLVLLLLANLDGYPLPAQTGSDSVKVKVGFSSVPLEVQIQLPPAAASTSAWVDGHHKVVKDALNASAPRPVEWPVTRGRPEQVGSEAGMMTYPAGPGATQNSFDQPSAGSTGTSGGTSTSTSTGTENPATLDDFVRDRPDIFENIPGWNPDISDRISILKEWVKITTERNEDYETAQRLIREAGQ